MSKSIKLNLGSGGHPIEGFINVDALQLPGTDVVCNLQRLDHFEDNMANVIYASHFLEHFSTADVPLIISDMYRVLKENGELRISVPDLDKICKLYLENIDWFTPPNNPWLGLLYGGQVNKYDFHKTGFNFRWLKFLLAQAGFTEIEEVDYFEEHGVLDGSFANMPFGKISLNVKARKSSGDNKISCDVSKYRYSIIEKLFVLVERFFSLSTKVIVCYRLKLARQRLKKQK